MIGEIRKHWLLVVGNVLVACACVLLFGIDGGTAQRALNAVVTHQYCGLPGAGGPLSITVVGSVEDEAGAPVAGCETRVSLALDVDGPVVITDREGRFTVTCRGMGWGKGFPTLTVSSPRFEPWHTNFDCWYRGDRQFSTRVVLKPKAPDQRGS